MQDVDVHARTLEPCSIEILSASEQDRAARFRFERDRISFVARRVFLREILGKYAGADPRAIEFEHNEFGKPSVKNGPLHFSASHSDGLAVIAISHRRPVGIDVERISPIDYRLLAEHFFSPAEASRIYDLESFYGLWTRKEAVLKALGTGLSCGLDCCETGWLVEFWTPVPGFISALASAVA